MNVEIRKLTLEDYEQLKSAMIESYSSIGGEYWRKERISKLIDIFPEGQICVVVDDKVVACALSIIVTHSEFGDQHTYQQVTGNYTFDTHNPEGDILYGIELFVHPDFRGLRLGRRLYDERKECCEKLNLRSVMAGGRIPKYHLYADELTPRQYIDKVKKKEIHDPTLSFQLSNDFYVKRILKNYLTGDTESKEFATLLEWSNVFYEPNKVPASANDTIIRLGLVQWQMRNFNGIDAFMEQVEYFVDVVSDYQADFILFPEFFNTPLMAPYNHLPEPEAMRQLASHTPDIRDKISALAISYNVNIISGSVPIVQDGELFNVSYLCHRSGKIDHYRKIHITPNERRHYGMVGGNEIPVFETDCGKVGIVICYDVEFPELARLMADKGMQILFVPFLTDTQNAYTRVRNCAQARAIENECYVAIAGCVGNLPKVNNMDIQYAQSVVFTPSDFGFPSNGIKAEATPNTEMMILADVDLKLLKQLNASGSVQILKDRRKDLYQVSQLPQKIKKEIPKIVEELALD